MQARDIKGLPIQVPEPSAGDGTVDDLILDMDERTVLALQLAWGPTGVQYAIATDDIAGLEGEVRLRSGAVPTPLADLPALIPLPTVNTILGQNVNTEDGRLLGRVADVEIDPETWQVTAFDVVGDIAAAFRDGAQSIPVDRVLAGERSLTVVSDS